MSKAKVEKRSKTMKPFVKYVNVRHVFPTRYVIDMDLKKSVDEADLANAEGKIEVKKGLKKEDAEAIKEKIEKVGGKVVLE